MKDLIFKIDEIYVPTKRRTALDPDKVSEIAASILEEGQQVPIMVRDDGKRLILVEGLHRLEACRSLGEETIVGIKVQARQR
ncbi:MAG: ParB N-terminal domain-containing protein [Proteobacteria bacterium]|nr:ParB N-terminal domain-containing protein [Pseudomonadota bacterium]